MKHPNFHPVSAFFLAATLGLFVDAVGSLHAQGIVIDEFSTAIPSSTENGSYLGPMLGGEVDVHVSPVATITYGATGGAFVLQASGTGAHQAQLHYDGVDGSSLLDFGLSADFTIGGTNDRLKVDVEVAAATGGIVMLVRVWEDNDNWTDYEHHISGSGTQEIPFADPYDTVGTGADLTDVRAVSFYFTASHGVDPEGETEIQLKSIVVGNPVAELIPGSIRPTLEFLKKKKLKKPRRRHTVKGLAGDNDAVTRVEAKVPGKKGWSKAKLRPGGQFIFRTPKLSKKNNRIKFRAVDANGIRSKIFTVRAKGRL